jgi:hypothetical protein
MPLILRRIKLDYPDWDSLDDYQVLDDQRRNVGRIYFTNAYGHTGKRWLWVLGSHTDLAVSLDGAKAALRSRWEALNDDGRTTIPTARKGRMGKQD